MRHTQGSAAVRFLLILGTFVALAVVAWMVSLGFQAVTTRSEPAAPVVAPQAPPSPTPEDELTKKAQAEQEKLAVELHQIQQEDSVLRVGGEVAPPARLTGAEPKYTEVARRARVQGVVIIEAIIDREGRVGATRLLKPLPLGLDQAALDAVKTWTFKPATRGGEPVTVYFTLTVEFKLR